MRKTLVAGALVLMGCLPGPAVVAAASARAAQAGADVAQAIESAKALKASGRAAEAADAMAAVLKKSPASQDAALFQVETLVELNRYDEALKTYDGYILALKKPDLAVLVRLGRADLVRTVRLKADQPIVRAQALERLARQGDADALTALRQQAGSTSAISPESLAPVVALARLGDKAGEARLGEMLNSGTPILRAQVIQAIGQGNVRSQAARLIPLLGDSDANVRNATAVALGLLQAKSAIPQLRNSFQNDEAGSVKMFAAIALKQVGDSSADTFLEGLLTKGHPEVQMFAAGAWQFSTSKSPAWDKAARTLLASPNDLHRLRAAELLASIDPVAAKGVLTSAMASENPLLRAGAARVFESRPELADAAVARRLVGDAAIGVRLHGAGLAHALATRK
jgi:HEAT repeat protein